MTGLQVAMTMPPPIPWMARPTRKPAMSELSAKISDPTAKQPQLTPRSRPPQRAAAMPDEMPATP